MGTIVSLKHNAVNKLWTLLLNTRERMYGEIKHVHVAAAPSVGDWA